MKEEKSGLQKSKTSKFGNDNDTRDAEDSKAEYMDNQFNSSRAQYKSK